MSQARWLTSPHQHTGHQAVKATAPSLFTPPGYVVSSPSVMWQLPTSWDLKGLQMCSGRPDGSEGKNHFSRRRGGRKLPLSTAGGSAQHHSLRRTRAKRSPEQLALCVFPSPRPALALPPRLQFPLEPTAPRSPRPPPFLPLGRSYLFGWLPEHIAHSAPAPQPVTQHRDDAHQQRLARVLFILLCLFCRDQLCEHGKPGEIENVSGKTGQDFQIMLPECPLASGQAGAREGNTGIKRQRLPLSLLCSSLSPAHFSSPELPLPLFNLKYCALFRFSTPVSALNRHFNLDSCL